MYLIDTASPGWSREGVPKGIDVADFTDKQGQYLSFIHLYSKINRQPPAIADIADYFQVSPPSAQNMVSTLVRKGLVEKTPRTARSLRVLILAEDIPALD
jgi:DNA-binding MarR family transcriptional regulator